MNAIQSGGTSTIECRYCGNVLDGMCSKSELLEDAANIGWHVGRRQCPECRTEQDAVR